MSVTIAEGGLDDPRVIALLHTHLARARAETGDGSAHALDLSGLRAPGLRFWSGWEGEVVLATGALKALSPAHGEVKSMHTAEAARGRGIGARIAWGAVADWWRSGMKTLAAIGICTCLGGALLPLALGAPGPAIVLLLCLLGTCAAGWTGLLLAEAARLAAPGKAGDAAGGVLSVAFAGVVVGPSLLGAAVAVTGSYSVAFGMLAVFPGLGALIAVLSLARGRRGTGA